MRRRPMRLTVFRMLLAIAVAAILMHLVTDPLRNRTRGRHERCLQLAAWHASNAVEYRKNARGDAGMLRISAWHDRMRRDFERAAERPGLPMPVSRPFPPAGWTAPVGTDDPGS